MLIAESSLPKKNPRYLKAARIAIFNIMQPANMMLSVPPALLLLSTLSESSTAGLPVFLSSISPAAYVVSIETRRTIQPITSRLT